MERQDTETPKSEETYQIICKTVLELHNDIESKKETLNSFKENMLKKINELSVKLDTVSDAVDRLQN